MKNAGQKLKEVRQDKDMTQKQIANKLKTTTQQISKYELNNQDMTTEVLKKWCIILKVSSDYILDIPKGMYDPR